MMVAMYPPGCLTGSGIIEGSVAILLATRLDKSIDFSNQPPHNHAVVLTNTYMDKASQSM